MVNPATRLALLGLGAPLIGATYTAVTVTETVAVCASACYSTVRDCTSTAFSCRSSGAATLSSYSAPGAASSQAAASRESTAHGSGGVPTSSPESSAYRPVPSTWAASRPESRSGSSVVVSGFPTSVYPTSQGPCTSPYGCQPASVSKTPGTRASTADDTGTAVVTVPERTSGAASSSGAQTTSYSDNDSSALPVTTAHHSHKMPCRPSYGHGSYVLTNSSAPCTTSRVGTSSLTSIVLTARSSAKTSRSAATTSRETGHRPSGISGASSVTSATGKGSSVHSTMHPSQVLTPISGGYSFPTASPPTRSPGSGVHPTSSNSYESNADAISNTSAPAPNSTPTTLRTTSKDADETYQTNPSSPTETIPSFEPPSYEPPSYDTPPADPPSYTSPPSYGAKFRAVKR
ncbi:Uncharacterized protein TCAP_00386 [Tolypocladium capitatum]|uniref:Uncharacterized protein n=1 Tax=Tolypocladium capitatum TaxID=45235 RepID=A0A2K3QQ84_9HYPO|nr:Uncharacterized protein TCAP_00386 [Tolypocladium capitatum]